MIIYAFDVLQTTGWSRDQTRIIECLQIENPLTDPL